MYISSFNYSLGDISGIETLPELCGDAGTFDYLSNLGLKEYSCIDEQVLPELLQKIIAQSLAKINAHASVEAFVFGTSFYSHVKHKDLPGRLLSALGLSHCVPYNISMGGCANFILALNVARSFISSGVYDVVCLITGDLVGDVKFSRIFPGKTTIGSDGFISCILSSKNLGLNDTYRINSVSLSIKPEMYNKTYENNLIDFINLYTEGYTEVLTRLYSATENKENVKWMIAGNYNRSVLKNFAYLAGFPLEKLYADSLPRIAHCFSADQLISLKELVEQGEVSDGEQVMVVGAGDYIWGALLLEKIN